MAHALCKASRWNAHASDRGLIDQARGILAQTAREFANLLRGLTAVAQQPLDLWQCLLYEAAELAAIVADEGIQLAGGTLEVVAGGAQLLYYGEQLGAGADRRAVNLADQRAGLLGARLQTGQQVVELARAARQPRSRLVEVADDAVQRLDVGIGERL